MRKSNRKKKRQNFFAENYKESWNYIKESRIFIYAVIAVFFLFVFAGAFLPTPEEVERTIIEIITQLFLKTEGMGHGELTSFIFFNNLQSSFFGVLFGIFLGFYPAFSAILNGYVLGYVSFKSVEVAGISSLWRL